MNLVQDHDKTKAQLISELETLRTEVARLKQAALLTNLLNSGDNFGPLSSSITQTQSATEPRTVDLTQVNEWLQREIAARQRLEQTLSLASQAAKLGFWQLDLITGVLCLSEQCKANFGLLPDAELSYQKLFEHVHSADRVRVQKSLSAALENHTDYEADYCSIWPDGSVHWIFAFGRPTYSEDGTPLRMDGITLDMSDRQRDKTEWKQVEADLNHTKAKLEARVEQRTAELQQTVVRLQQEIYERQQVEVTNQKFISLIESSSDFIGIATLDGQVLYVNEAGQKLVGLAGDEAVRRTQVAKYFTPTDLTYFHSHILPVALAQGRWVGEYRFRHFQTGETIPVHYNFFVIRDKDTEAPIALATVTQDIRDRKQAEEALRQSEAKFRFLCENSPVGIFMMDAQNNCVYVNPRCQEICGLTVDEALGDNWAQCLHPSDREQSLAKRTQAISQQQGFSATDCYVHKDGSIRYGQVQTAPIFAIDQKLIGYVGTIEDITERQAIEKMKHEFVSIVSHELRTPLSSIRGSLGLLTSGVLQHQPETAKQMLEIAAIETERLVRLVNDILDLERLEFSKVTLNWKWCNAATLMHQAVEALRPLANESQIRLAFSPLDLEIWADPDRIIQTLVNLLYNAIKFSAPESNVYLTARLITKEEPMICSSSLSPICASVPSPPYSTETNRTPFPYVLFQVTDQGRGIPADQLEKIFGRFHQVDASDSRQKGGTGLGLTICRSIVQQHSGRIWAESVLGEGSTFYFTLPLPLQEQ